MHRTWDRGAFLLSLPALLFLLALFIYPFLYGVELSVHPAGGYSLANYQQFFSDAFQRDTILTTLIIALPATFVNVALSVPLAYAMRRGIRGERFIATLLVIPMTLGTVLVAEGMLRYFGPRGWFNQALMGLHLTQDPLQITHSVLGVQIALFINGFPLAFLMLLGYTSGINPDLERAARMLGASAWQTFTRVLFPLMMPGIAIAFALNFVMAFSVFPSAVLVGQPSGPTRVMAIAAYQAAFEKYDYSLGSAIALMMTGIELIFVFGILAVRSRLYRGASIAGGKG